jgi:hypothetical protein
MYRRILIALLVGGVLATQSASAGMWGGPLRDDGRQQRREMERRQQLQAQEFRRQQEARPPPPQYRAPEPPPMPQRPGISPGDAARRAQGMYGGGRVLSVDPNGPDYRVKLLKDGEVRVITVPGG